MNKPVPVVGLLALLAVQCLAQFDQDTAQRFLYYSYAAYLPDNVQNWSGGYCIGATEGFVPTALASNDTIDTFGYVGYHPQLQEIVVSFRGTHNLDNWIEDLKILKDKSPFPGCPSGTVATGFAQCYLSLADQIVPAVQALVQQFPSYPVRVTGHSLGGAISSLCALDLNINVGVQNVQVLNFGSPRVGDSDFAVYFNNVIGSIMRMTHQDDIVPHLPPYDFNFEHVPTEVWENDGQYNVCNGSGEDPNCADSVPVIDFSVSDHLSYMDVQCCEGPQ